MKIIPIYESHVNSKGNLEDFTAIKILYNDERASEVVDQFTNEYGPIMDKKGWMIVARDTDIDEYDTTVVWAVEKNDELGILLNDAQAHKMASQYGWKLDNKGVIVGFDDERFIDIDVNESRTRPKAEWKESEEIYKEGTQVQEFDIYGLPMMKSGKPVIRTCIPDELKREALMGKADKKYNSHDYVSIDLCKKNYKRFVPIDLLK